MSSMRRSNSIRTPAAPNEGGFLGRLMQRTRSLRDTTRKRYSTHETAVTDSQAKNSKAEDTQVASVERGLTPSAPQNPETDTMGAAVLGYRQPQPTSGLRKRASIRDRLRSLGRDNPEQKCRGAESQAQQQAQLKPRVVYVPTHAAADFSRLAVSPRPRYFTEGEPRGTVTTAQLPVDVDGLRHPYSPGGLQTLAEDRPVQGGFRQMQQPKERWIIDSSLGQERKSNPTNQSRESRAREHQYDEPNSEPNDFEVFLTRAEQEDRAYRQHLVQTLERRQWPRPHTADPEVGHQSAYPQHAHDSAVVTDPSIPRKHAWDGGRVSSGPDSGIGSKSSSGNGTWERGHKKRTSLTLSLGRGDRFENEAESGGYTTAKAAPAVRPAYNPPRTLKKQISIKKKLGEYIRPAKVQKPFDEPVYEVDVGRGKGKAV